jgi:hypothetical protein
MNARENNFAPLGRAEPYNQIVASVNVRQIAYLIRSRQPVR